MSINFEEGIDKINIPIIAIGEEKATLMECVRVLLTDPNLTEQLSGDKLSL